MNKRRRFSAHFKAKVALAAIKGGDVPWWRVINAEGAISPRGPDGISEEMQRDLLESEGVEFSLERQVDLARFRHRPESADD